MLKVNCADLYRKLSVQLVKVFIVSLIGMTVQWLQANNQMITMPDGAQLRLAHWPSKSSQAQPVSVILLQGRSCYIEKFQEFTQDLQNRGYDLWTFDWRGSGGSSRLIADDSQKFYIDRYETYLKDLDDLIQNVIRPQTTKPILLLGISMGGHLALRYLEGNSHQVAGALVLAPMVDIHSRPYPNWLARIIVHTATVLGFGKNYVIGYGNYDINQPAVPENTSTTDLRRYQQQQAINKANMRLVTAGPTYQWVDESFKSIDMLHRPREINKISVPLTMIKAEYDAVIDTSKDEAFCAQIPQCHIRTYQQARHNILIEVDSIRACVFQDLDDLVKRVMTQRRDGK